MCNTDPKTDSQASSSKISDSKLSDSNVSNSKALAKMLAIGQTEERIWQPQELDAILKHQLRAPIQFDLECLDPTLAGKLQTLCAAEGLLLRSFEDLFFHPNPPLELLELTKQFAKACRLHPDSPLPEEVSILLYFASIAVARMRCGRRITDLDDVSLRRSLQWLIEQSWLEENLRLLLVEALGHLDKTTTDTRNKPSDISSKSDPTKMHGDDYKDIQ